MDNPKDPTIIDLEHLKATKEYFDTYHSKISPELAEGIELLADDFYTNVVYTIAVEGQSGNNSDRTTQKVKSKKSKTTLKTKTTTKSKTTAKSESILSTEIPKTITVGDNK